VVEHCAHSNKSDIIDLGLWWCRRGDSRQYNARNRYYRSLAISGLTRLFGLHSPTGLKTSGGSLEHQGPRIEMQPWRALSVGKRC
jgi:hypothetical protein